MRIEPVTDGTAELWRDVHNLVIPAEPLSAQDVADRRTRYHLTVAYVGDELVGNATVRPPAEGSRTATVIVRVLPARRRQGLGTQYLGAMTEQARTLGATSIHTVVLLANADGLRFAEHRGFVESDRYTLDNGSEYVELVRPL